MKPWLKTALLLVVLCTLPIVAIQARPYADRVRVVLADEDCPAPCFLGIRPGVTTASKGILRLVTHDWVASRIRDFPPPVDIAVAYDANISRFVLEWRWSMRQPEWIDAAHGGSIIVENRDVLALMFDTRLTLGEIVLAFGAPDEAQFAASRGAGRDFIYSAWYGQEGMHVSVAGRCPTWRYHNLPARIAFRAQPPAVPDPVTLSAACG